MTWNDVSVTTYQELIELFRENKLPKEEFDIKLISFLKDLPEDELENMSLEEYNVLAKAISFCYSIPPGTPKQSVETKAGNLYLIDDLQSTLTIGEYIDLEYFYAKGYVKNLQVICSILYRQKINSNPLLFKDTFEKYGNYIYLRADLFDSIPISQVYGVIPKYLAFKEQWEETYSNQISSAQAENLENEYDPNESYIEKAKRIEEEEDETDREKFGWDYFLWTLSKLNNCTFEEATQIPLTQAFGLHALRQAFKIQI